MQLNFDIGITMEFFYNMPTIEHEVFSCILVRSKLGRNTIIKDGQWTGYQHSINYSQQYAIIITTNSKDIKFCRFPLAERKHRGTKVFDVDNFVIIIRKIWLFLQDKKQRTEFFSLLVMREKLKKLYTVRYSAFNINNMKRELHYTCPLEITLLLDKTPK